MSSSSVLNGGGGDAADKNVELEALPKGRAHDRHGPNAFHVLTPSFPTPDLSKAVAVLAAI